MRLALLALSLVSLLVAPTAVAAAPAGSTLTVQGTVVAKDRAHRGLVVSTSGGAVRMIRAPRSFAATDVGRRVSVRFRLAAGGLPVAVGIERGGVAAKAVVRGTVLRLGRSRAVLSAGGSALSVSLAVPRRQRVLSSSGSGPGVGDTVRMDVEIDDDGSLDATAIVVTNAGAPSSQAGSEGELEVRGTVTALSPAVVVRTGTGVIVTCVVPAGAPPTGVAVGDLVEVECDLVAGQWTLRRVHAEEDDDEEEDAGHAGSPALEAHGTIVSLDPLQVRLTSGEVISCRLPAGVTLPTIVPGQRVEVKCRSIDGVLTLARLKADGADDDHEDDARDEESSHDDDDD